MSAADPDRSRPGRLWAFGFAEAPISLIEEQAYE
jgi:hypothetical protein